MDKHHEKDGKDFYIVDPCQPFGLFHSTKLAQNACNSKSWRHNSLRNFQKACGLHFKDNIKAFESTAKKYGIDFALKKDATETPPRYLVFFKGRDADALTAAFKEFSAKKLTQDKKPSIRKALAAFREKAKELNASRQQTKHKDREVSL